MSQMERNEWKGIEAAVCEIQKITTDILETTSSFRVEMIGDIPAIACEKGPEEPLPYDWISRIYHNLQNTYFKLVELEAGVERIRNGCQ